VPFQFHPLCNVMYEVFFFFLSNASSILVVALIVISLKFMQGEKYVFCQFSFSFYFIHIVVLD
jgi:hypothetical protein